MTDKGPGVQTVERSFKLLELLAKHPDGMQLQELAAGLGLAKSTLHRLVQNLVALGYVTQHGASGRYRATLKLFEIGSGVVAGMDVVSIAREHLDRLSGETGEAVHLVVPDGADIVYVYKADAASMRMSSRVGLRRPMYCTGVGKAILASMAYRQVEDIWAASTIEPLTPFTLIEFGALEKQLAQTRRRGWAVDDEENELGIRCVATALLGPGGAPVAAFSVTGLAPQMDDARMERLAGQCLAVKAEIQREMGL